jgi:Glycosyl transferase family 8
MESRGIVYIAIGLEHLERARQSADSLMLKSESNRLLNITIFTDCISPQRNLLGGFGDDGIGFNIRSIRNSLQPIAHWDSDKIAACVKTWIYDLSPYDKTLFLDDDIKAIKCIDSIWDKVEDGIGFARAFNPLLPLKNRYPGSSEESQTIDAMKTSGDFTQYNSGVFLFTRNRLVENFFQFWNLEYSLFRKHENMALTRVLNEYMGLPQITELDKKYNDFYPNKDDHSVLIHFIGHYKKYWNDYT